MRYHPTRTRLHRLTEYPTRHGRVSRRAVWLAAAVLALAWLFITYTT